MTQQRSEDDLSHIMVSIIKTNKTLQEKIDKDKCSDVAMIAYNPSAFKRSEITRAYVQVPNDWEGKAIEITDARDNKVEFDIAGKDDSYYQVVQSPNDCANSFLMSNALV